MKGSDETFEELICRSGDMMIRQIRQGSSHQLSVSCTNELHVTWSLVLHWYTFKMHSIQSKGPDDFLQKSLRRYKKRPSVSDHPTEIKRDGRKHFRREDSRAVSETIRKSVKNLPIASARNKIVQAVLNNDSIIILGETGCGKTTQVPQYILQAGLSGKGIIGVTQPRRVAAISISARVAQEMGVDLGQTVGYSVRFEEQISSHTKLKYMTDGMLLREAIGDPLLLKYSVILLDEIHERSLQTDILLGIIKRCQQSRKGSENPNLKVILMSATMDVDLFSAYFNKCPVYYLAGRQFPIKNMNVVAPHDDYVQTALLTVLQVHESQPEGDILVFCTGQEEIQSMVSAITSSTSHDAQFKRLQLVPIGLYASLPSSQQMLVFEPSILGKTRKVIFSTNVAETSITIPGVKYVIDTGKVKTRNFNSRTGFESLKVENISKAQAEQRSGRAGREAPGICYRLYTEEEFAAFKDFAKPEILRVSLTSTLITSSGPWIY